MAGTKTKGQPVVVSTWNSGLAVNAEAWKVLQADGYALDAVENAARSIERLVKINPAKSKEFQVGFIALKLAGEVGAYAMNKGFSYSVTDGRGSGKAFAAESYHS